MLSLLLPLVFAAQPGVVIGTYTRASTVTVSPVGKAKSGLGELPALEVMLTDVMSPRLMQRRASEASQFMLDVTLGEAVIVEPRAPDALTRQLGDDEGVTAYGRVRLGKVWLHEALVAAGWAWVLPEARKDKALVTLEDEARAAKRGLWADESPVEPWLWREVMMLSDVEGNVLHAGWDCPHASSLSNRRRPRGSRHTSSACRATCSAARRHRERSPRLVVTMARRCYPPTLVANAARTRTAR